MKTLADIQSLVNRLVAVLQQDGPTATDRDLADEYADACLSVNERLSQCSRMIDEGSSMQALMLAEEKPNLLDAVAALSFAKSTDWHEACALNGLRQAPRIDRSAVHKVNDLYTKGNRSDQTKALYKQFRAAMAARDDASALGIISAIASLDPTDADAGKELARLERKHREDLLNGLRSALAANKEAIVLSLLEDCVKLGITDASEISSAMVVRNRVFAERARQDIADIIPSLADLQARGLWQQCGERATRISSLATTYRLSLSAQDSLAVDSATSYFNQCRQQALHKARFNESVSALSDCADRIHTGEKASSKVRLDAIEQNRLQLKKAYEKAKEFALPLPDKLIERVGQLASNLDGEIERLRRARKIRNVAIGTTVCLLFTCLGVGGYFFIRASQFANELRALVSERKSMPLRAVVEQIEEKYSAYLAVPSLKTALFEAKAWLDGVKAQSTAAASAIAQALTLVEVDFANTTPEKASALFKQANDAIDGLPEDLANTMRPNLLEAQGKLKMWLSVMRDDRVVAAKKKIEETRDLLVNLDATDNVEKLKEAFSPIAIAVESLLQTSDSKVEEMDLPAAMKAEITDMAAKVERIAGAIRAYDTALSTIASSKTIADYANGIEQMSLVDFPRLPEVKAAQMVATKKIDSHEFLGGMVLPSAPEVWATIKQSSDLSAGIQLQKTRESEVDSLRDLINNENLVGVYEATIRDYGGSSSTPSERKVFVRGKLSVSDQDGRVTTASGTVYDPALSGSRVSFQEQAFVHTYSPATSAQSGKRVASQKESDASAGIQKLALKQLVSSDGSKYSKNILDVIDNVASSREVPALVKAYVIQELAKIAKSRPNIWGLAWVPSLDEDLAQMREIVGGQIDSGDWMNPAKSSINQKLSNWFKQREGLSYMQQQTINKKLAKAAMDAGLSVCGYVGTDGEFVETDNNAAANAITLWALESSTGKPIIVFTRSGNPPEVAPSPNASAFPLSPVFVLPINSNESVSAAFKATDVPQDLLQAYARYLPPAFAYVPSDSANAP